MSEDKPKNVRKLFGIPLRPPSFLVSISVTAALLSGGWSLTKLITFYLKSKVFFFSSIVGVSLTNPIQGTHLIAEVYFIKEYDCGSPTEIEAEVKHHVKLANGANVELTIPVKSLASKIVKGPKKDVVQSTGKYLVDTRNLKPGHYDYLEERTFNCPWGIETVLIKSYFNVLENENIRKGF